MILICIIASIITGFSIAVYFVVKSIKNTNDIGDTTSELKDFGAGSLHMQASEDIL